ncbi:MAG: cation transporter [Gemmatimonadetes bacterium]|nr:cation transporter [Gemmatimonadota bacterium]
MHAVEEVTALRRGRRLEYLTIGWNALEAAASLAAGVLAGSTALIGFGVDSAIESASGAALLWRLQEGAAQQERERTALRLVGVSFLALAGYVAYEAAESLISRKPPDASYLGIGIAVLSLLVMPWLARQKRAVAARIQSRALESDSRQTSICAYLSAILLGGLALNAVLGWWWADPVAALAMVPVIAQEGVEALRGEQSEGA